MSVSNLTAFSSRIIVIVGILFWSGWNMKVSGQKDSVVMRNGKECHIVSSGLSEGRHGVYFTVKAALAEPDSVVELILQSADLTEFPIGLYKCRNLEKLDLSGNQLTRVPEGLSAFPKLRELYLNNNNITSTEGLDLMPVLDYLSMQNNPLLRVGEEVAKNTTITKLWFGAYGRTVEFHPSIWEMTGLRKLRLMGVGLKEIPEAIGEMKYLHTFCVNDNHIEKIPASIKSLTFMEYLSFGNNNVSELPEGIEQMKGLNYLGFFGNPIKNVPPFVLEFDNLEWLAAWNTSMTQDQISELEEQISQTTIKANFDGNDIK